MTPPFRGCVLVAAAILGGCGSAEAPRSVPTGANLPKTRVSRVVDADTVVLKRLGRTQLIGVQAPSKGSCFEQAATRFTRSRLAGNRVGYEFDNKRRSRDGERLVYLYRGAEMHNLALLEGGYAKALVVSPNDKHASHLFDARLAAEQGRKGIWSDACKRQRRAKARARARARRRARAEARRQRRVEAQPEEAQAETAEDAPEPSTGEGCVYGLCDPEAIERESAVESYCGPGETLPDGSIVPKPGC
jgi:endonuclease YncB( thermonuclease family)